MSKLVLTLIDEVNCHIDGLSSYDVDRIVAGTKLPDPQAFMTAAFQTGNWDGKVSFFDEETHIFLQHMLDDVLAILDSECGYDIDADMELIDERLNQDLVFSDIKPIDEHFFGDLLDFSMREYQVNGVNQTLLHQKGILEYGTSAGKTIICAAIAKVLEDRLKTLTIVPSATLLKQTLKQYEALGLDAKGITPKVKTDKRADVFSNHQHIVLTRQIALNCGDMFDSSEFAMLYDECFPDYAEVLTDQGFVPFDDLEPDHLVAQYHHGGTIDFVTPSRYVKKRFDGYLVELTGQGPNPVHIQCTPNHDLVLSRSVTGDLVKMRACEFTPDFLTPSSNFMVTSGITKGPSEAKPIPDVIKLMAMTFSTTSCDTPWMVDIDRMPVGKAEETLLFVKDAGIPHRVSGNILHIDAQCPSVPNIEAEGFGIADLTTDGAKYLLDLMESFSPKGTISVVSERLAKLVEVLCLLCGETPMTSEMINNIIRVDRSKINRWSTRGMKKSGTMYHGDVYCVTVPTGMIIVRQHGAPVVVGNCHELGEEFAHFMRTALGDCPVRIGLTGTVPNKKLKRAMVENHIGGPVLDIVSTHYLMSNNYVSQSYIDMYQTIHPEIEELSDTKDENQWNFDIEARYLSTHKGRIEAIAEFIKSFEPTNTLILCHPETGRNLAPYFGDRMITDETPLSQREEWIARFDDENDFYLPASYGTIGTGVSIDRIFRMFMIDVGKNEVYIRQGFGRGLRLDGERNECHVVDISARTKYSARHRKDRKRILKREKIPFTEISENIRVFDTGE